MTSPSNDNNQEIEEPTTEWLINQICPHSPLLDFNKQRLLRKIAEQRIKDLQKISFYAGIPVEVLEGYLRSKD